MRSRNLRYPILSLFHPIWVGLARLTHCWLRRQDRALPLQQDVARKSIGTRLLMHMLLGCLLLKLIDVHLHQRLQLFVGTYYPNMHEWDRNWQEERDRVGLHRCRGASSY